MKTAYMFRSLTGALFALAAFVLPAEAQPWGTANVVPLAKGYSYTVREVYFKSPQTYKNRPDRIERTLTALKVTVYGKGLKEQDTGPVLWLNRLRANFVHVADDGLSMEAYFYLPLSKMEMNARELKKWELVYQQNYHSGEAFMVPPRIKPLLKPSDYYAKPAIRLLTKNERRKLKMLEEKYRKELADH